MADKYTIMPGRAADASASLPAYSIVFACASRYASLQQSTDSQAAAHCAYFIMPMIMAGPCTYSAHCDWRWLLC